MLKTNLKVNESANVFTSVPPKFVVAKKQKSIKKVILIEGVGLHTGNNVSMTLRPAPINTGYVFRITKANKKIELKADFRNVKSTQLCTLLSDNEGNTISTVEHILSACYGLEIDNIFIDTFCNDFLLFRTMDWTS